MGSNPILSATPPRNIRSMNCKQRRAAKSRGPAGGSSGATDALFKQALRHHQLGQWFEAEAACRTILERDPKHLGGLHMLGVLAQSRGAHDEAAARFRSVIALKPDIAAVHYGLGRALAEAGWIEDAVAAFERARALDAAHNAAGPQPDYRGPISTSAISPWSAASLPRPPAFTSARFAQAGFCRCAQQPRCGAAGAGQVRRGLGAVCPGARACAGADRSVRKPRRHALPAQSGAGRSGQARGRGLADAIAGARAAGAPAAWPRSPTTCCYGGCSS